MLAMFLYIRYSGKREQGLFHPDSRRALGDLDGYIQEMVSGQKVVKVFNHEEENLAAFREKNEAPAQGGNRARRAMPPRWFPRW